jgi:hypothetical protein
MKISLNEQALLARVMTNIGLKVQDIRKLSPKAFEKLLVSLAAAKLNNLARKTYNYYYGEDVA